MGEPRDPRSPEVFRRYVGLLQDINVLGVMGFAQLLDSLEPEEMNNLMNIVLHLQAFLDSKKIK